VIPSLQTLDWSRFLKRQSLAPPPREALDLLRRTPILIAGAGGSIGSALALRLAALSPPTLVLLEASESNLYALQRVWAEASVTVPTVFILGSVADRNLLDEIFAVRAPRLVFHAAAFKHVPVLEEQPLAAIENNVFGTRTLTQAASSARVILLSTDKAVEPASIMGATKRIAEHIVLDAGGAALRLGNVLASRGSVAEVFASQVAAGGPLTVTSLSARRYFLTLDEAVNLLLAAAVEPESNALLAPVLSAPHAVVDLARFIAEALAPGRAIPIRITGPRPGDKVAEIFWSAAETARPAIAKVLLAIQSPTCAGGPLRNSLATLRAALDGRDLPTAIAQLRILVPEYTPGPVLTALATHSASQAFT